MVFFLFGFLNDLFNFFPDFFANAALSKMGFGVMAVTGCFAGQLFNLLIGFGSALLRQTIKKFL